MSSCSSEGGGVGAHRVLRFDPARGAAGAYYCGDASFRSGGSGFGFGSATAATTPEEASRAFGNARRADARTALVILGAMTAGVCSSLVDRRWGARR